MLPKFSILYYSSQHLKFFLLQGYEILAGTSRPSTTIFVHNHQTHLTLCLADWTVLHSAKLEESKELRKYRRRQAGVSAEGLLVGETNTKKESGDVSPDEYGLACKM